MKAVIFDLDGTIGDTLVLCIEAFREAIEPFIGRRLTDEQIVATFGPSEEGTVMHFAPEYFDEALEVYRTRYREMHPAICPAPFDGMREILEWLRTRGVVLGLVTGKGKGTCDITLPFFGIDHYFDRVITGDPRGSIKAEAIAAILGEFGLESREAIYVGDAPSDVTNSHQAGVPAVAAAWAPATDREALQAVGPDYLFTTVGDFARFLQEQI